MRDPAPDSLTFAIAGSSKCISASRTLCPGLIAVTLEHQLRRAPNVDLGYHVAKVARPLSIKV
jgi:hypothetical protein